MSARRPSFLDGPRVRAAARRSAIVLAIACCSAAHAGGLVLYVDDDGAEGGSGATWAAALPRLQDALALAEARGSGVSEIRVAQGVYRPDQTAQARRGTRDRNATFRLISGVMIRGGYRGLAAGRGESPDDRDVMTFRTILSGDLAADDPPPKPSEPPTFENTADNAYQVATALNVDSTAVLEGFVVTAGRADGIALGATPDSRDQGGGLNVYFASPTVMQCAFERNYAINHGAVNDHGDDSMFIDCTFVQNHSADFGAGLYVHHHSHTMAIGCAFLNNIAVNDGAGAYSRSEHGAEFIDCMFCGNAAKRGAGMYTDPDSINHVVGCLFAGNDAESGAGLYNDFNATMIIQCSFIDNHALIGGGGVYNNQGYSTVSACSFSGNEASFDSFEGGGGGGGSGGGGVWNAGGAPEVSDCLFTGNRASFGAGVYNGDDSLARVTRCQFQSNLASEGAGCYNISSNAIIRDCQFASNHVSGGAFPVGGGVSSYFCDALITGCTFTGNSAQLGGGGMYNEGDSPTVVNCHFLANIANGDGQGWGGGILNSFASLPTVANCVFLGNSAHRGGAIFNTVFTQAAIINCTMVGNSASGQADAFGGGLYNSDETQTVLANCILWGNSPDSVAGTPPDATFSCIEGGFDGRGNIDADPMFVRAPSSGIDGVWLTDDDDLGDLRLQANGPCIDAGDNAMVPVGLMLDFDGHLRVLDGSGDGSAVVDMGPYELRGGGGAGGCAPDIAGADGVVNLDDVLAVIMSWGQCPAAPGSCPADIAPPGGDGAVDHADLHAVIVGWGPCP